MSKAMRLLKYSPRKGFKFLRQLELTYSPNVDVYYNMGVALLHLNKLEDALKYFKKTLQLDPNYEPAQESFDFTSTVIKMLNRKYSEKNWEKDLEDLGTLANSAREEGLFNLAIRINRFMVDLAKEKAGALNDLGLSYQDQNRLDEAIACYDKALELEPGLFEALSNKAACMMSVDRVEEACTLYKRLIELKPDFLQGWYNLGYIDIKKENYNEALNCMNKAIELNDEYYLAWLAKYYLLTEMKRIEEAETCFKKAWDLNPEYVAQVAFGEAEKFHQSNMRSKSHEPPHA
jgi:tetratricopeptide (TPR) repeat protein